MPQLRGNYKLAKKEILTVWEADYPQKPLFPTSRRGNYYVGTQELLRRDVGKWASREERNRRWNRLELGFEGDIGREHGWSSKRGKRSKGQKVKSHIWQKWKSESEKVNIERDEWWTRWMGWTKWTRWMVNLSILWVWMWNAKKVKRSKGQKVKSDFS